MNTAEQGPRGSPDRANLLQKLKNLLDRLLFQKKLTEEMKREARERQETILRRETKVEHGREETRQRQIDEGRAYHQAKSGDIEKVQASIVRAERAAEVKRILEEGLANSKRPDGSDYFFEELKDENTKNALIELIETSESPTAVEVIFSLIDKDSKIHGSGIELIKAAQRLAYEAGKAGIYPNLTPVFQAISRRAQEKVWEEFEVDRRTSHRRGYIPPENYREFFERDSSIVMTDVQKKALAKPELREGGGINWEQTREEWGRVVNDLITQQPRRDQPKAAWVTEKAIQGDQVVVKQLTTPVDKIWGEIERVEGISGGQLSSDDLLKYYDQIREAESAARAKDVPAGSEAYMDAYQQARGEINEKLDVLAKKAAKRLQEESPKVRTGIVDPNEFLETMPELKGRLGGLLAENPEMKKLFFSEGEKGGRFRNRIFLKIHSSVISDQRNASHDNFGLYERADFTTFIDFLRQGHLAKIILPETGESMGQAWADYYNSLSNAIRQSRDIDFWASQPGANIENFQKSLGMFQNEYLHQTLSIPAVAAADRIYETVLRSAITAHDGYLPPGLMEYDARNKGTFWDQRVREMLKQSIINQGAIKDVARHKETYFPIVGPDGVSMVESESPLGEKHPIDAEEISMYMVLAKGIGMATCRYMEIIANTKIPGSDHPEYGLQGEFHSIPYEGVARALNYMSTHIQKWKIGAYKYAYLINMLIPENKKLKNIDDQDPTLGIELYNAHLDGTFEEKYGSDAKRFFDLLNFSKISSAIGKDTLWRQYDGTVSWSDRQREHLGSGTRLALVDDKYAGEAVKKLLVTNKYREMYREELIQRNRNNPHLALAESGAGFDRLWAEYGSKKYEGQINVEWNRLLGWDPKKGKKGENKQTKHLIEAFGKALKARIWVEMAMRNPLAAAHSLKDSGESPLGEKIQLKLHQKLVQDILGIPPEDLKYACTYGKAGYGTTPEKSQRDKLIAVLQLEGDLAAVREKAIAEGRDLKKEDFDIIKDPTRQKQALAYWEKVRQVILGDTRVERAEELYKEFGLGVAENGQDYEWDIEKIEKLVLEGKLKETVETKLEWIVATDDMDFGKIDWLNLGSRHLVRRGGDIAAHWMGGEAMSDYIIHGIVPNPDKHELAKMLLKLRDAYSGDMVEAGWSVAGNLAYMTDRFYKWDLSRAGSVAQRDVWHTRRNVAAWMANGRREFWDALEHLDVLPPHAQFYHYNIPDEKITIDWLRKKCHADNWAVARDIVFLGFFLALAITIYRAFTAPSEEEEGGGGRH